MSLYQINLYHGRICKIKKVFGLKSGDFVELFNGEKRQITLGEHGYLVFKYGDYSYYYHRCLFFDELVNKGINNHIVRFKDRNKLNTNENNLYIDKWHNRFDEFGKESKLLFTKNISKQKALRILKNNDMDETAKKLGIHRKTLIHRLKLWGVYESPRLRDKTDRKELKKLISQGKNIKELAEKFNVAYETIRRYIWEWDLQEHYKNTKAKYKNLNYVELITLAHIFTNRELAKMYGVTEKTISRWFKDAKFKKPNLKYDFTKIDEEVFKELYKVKTKNELAEIYGVNATTIETWKQRFKVPNKRVMFRNLDKKQFKKDAEIYTNYELANKYGIAYRTVGVWKRRLKGKPLKSKLSVIDHGEFFEYVDKYTVNELGKIYNVSWTTICKWIHMIEKDFNININIENTNKYRELPLKKFKEEDFIHGKYKRK